jgi:ABC-2 type transport system ATP-binding protein
MDNGVAVRDVWRTFGAVPALSGMTLTAPYGQVTALVGPNGAGKTTLLLILASLLRPDRGEVSVAGADPTREAHAVRSRIGWMPDAFGVYDQLTVREYLDFFAAAYRIDARHRPDAGRRAARAGAPERVRRPAGARALAGRSSDWR